MNRARLYRVGVKRRLALPSLEPRGLQEEEEDNAPQHVSRCFRAFNYLTSVFLARPPCVYKLHTILFVPRCSRFFVSREEREGKERDQVVNTNVRLIGRFFEILLATRVDDFSRRQRVLQVFNGEGVGLYDNSSCSFPILWVLVNVIGMFSGEEFKRVPHSRDGKCFPCFFVLPLKSIISQREGRHIYFFFLHEELNLNIFESPSLPADKLSQPISILKTSRSETCENVKMSLKIRKNIP